MALTINNFAHLRIPLEDIVKATDNFADANIIGDGVFGPAYRGRLSRSGKLMKIVALRLNRKYGLGDFEFWTEVSVLSDLKHTNLVSIIGICDEKNEKIIVITHEANGSLKEHLNSTNLTWTQRLRISVGLARVLAYLHHDEGRGYGVIHRNINSSTILLDENWEAKLSGFIFSVKQSINRMDEVVLCEPIGVIGYVDPVIEKSIGVNYKSDIYSFGVVLFEILCGREAFISGEVNTRDVGFLAPLAKDHYENKTLKDIIQNHLWNQMFGESLLKYSQVAYACLEEEQSQRPDMDYIVIELENALKLQLQLENLENKWEYLKIPLGDIKLATDDFSDKHKLLEHPSVYIYYGARLVNLYKENSSNKDEVNVIIKRLLPRKDKEGENVFFNEIEMLTSVKHPGIVTLLGFCVEGSEKILVLERFSNGNVNHYLDYVNRMGILTWEKLLKICIDVARTLNYLHFEMEDQKTIINRDINSCNIWLDENWRAKIVEFGVAVKMPPNQVDEAIYVNIVGQKCYVDPEYVETYKLKRESDVYSFGVVLFEFLCGRAADDPIYLEESEEGLAYVARRCFTSGTLEEIIDPAHFLVNGGLNMDSLNTLIRIAYQCVAVMQEKRPTMKDVLRNLEQALSLHVDQAQRPYTNHVVYGPEKELQVQPPIENIIFMKLEHLKKIDLSTIKLATNNFSDTYSISFGGYYTLHRANIPHFDDEHPSYVEGKNKGVHTKGHNTVIIKRTIPTDEGQENEKFCTSIEMHTRVKHANIVTLLGYCIEDDERILVFEDVPNGFLGACLTNVNMRILTWEKRLKICIDVANALNYLHYEMEDQKMIINRHIKSYNIGLDENWGAKIMELGVCIYLPPNQVANAIYPDRVVGNTYYLDPEYDNTMKLKRESDVYSFGVVLFEVLCGKLAYNPIYVKESSKGLAHVARQSFCTGTLKRMIDPILLEEFNENNFLLNKGPGKDSLHTFIEIASQCVMETQDQRPTIKAVLEELKKALFIQKNNKGNPKMSLEDIKKATQNFNDGNCIGEGGFGTVYKGELDNGNGVDIIVAKRLKFVQLEQQFLRELQIVLDYKHENVIGLVGYCDEKNEKIIVYEYASRGSLDRYLKSSSLTWMKRLGICINVASALDFLHGGVGRQAKVIHRDIKTANILLNHEWKAKLADFGLSLISPITQETDYVIDHKCGTPGYVDPLYQKSRFLTMESDIYSFGVVLFEILCGRLTFEIQKNEGHHLPAFIKNKFDEGKHDEVVFEKIREQILRESLTTFQRIAYQCLNLEREKRPGSKKVLTQLKKALEFQNMASTMTKLNHLQISLEEVEKATNNFHDDNIIGHSGFVTSYKGQLLRSGRLIMITARRFDCNDGKGDLEFWTELSVLYNLKHTNLVSIIGFCDEKEEGIIITTYEANGNIGQYLNDPKFTWTQRLKACICVARVLSFLHYEEGRDYAIIHCNINSNTILLDEIWEAKLSGFEICIKQSLCYKDQVCLCEHTGTMGFVDPTIKKTGGVTQKSDIYSFGVVLFELLSGRKAYIENEDNIFLAPSAKYHYENKTLHDIIHPDLHMSLRSLIKYSDVAYSCLNEDRAYRPSMNYIVDELEKALELQQEYDNIVTYLQRMNLEHLKINLADIKYATDNFSETYKIQHEELYTCYKAELKHFDKQNPSSVVIKRWHREELFFVEMKMLTSVKHANVVTLLGFCVEGSETILVIEDFTNGFLGDYLTNNDNRHTLTWEKRLKICIDVAHALKYMHFEMGNKKMIIHRDICSYNIGFDENWGAKIVGFAGSVLLPLTKKDKAVHVRLIGRPSYIDPEYEKSRMLKRKSDVYSFGVVLFEVLCGKLSYDQMYCKEDSKGLARMARQSFYKGTIGNMIDSIIKGETSETIFVLNKGPNKDSLHTFIEIAHKCVAETQDQRPTMRFVVKELEKAFFLQKNNKDNPRIPFEEIELATQNFHDDNCIGGAELWKVYKGNLQDDIKVKAIVAKRLDMSFGLGEKQFLSELKLLWEYKHENIIGLVGYCDEKDEKIIIYENVSKGSLDRYLNEASLTWMKRLNICINIASALDFLHGGVGKQAKVIHGDIKASNVLLNDDWEAKLAGFRHSIPITQETNYVIDHACGTPGYVDPLYRKSGFLTIESDIYSFGVVLFEILCGRSTMAIQEHEGCYLPDFIRNIFEEGKYNELVFQQIREQIMPESLTMFQDIAYQCLHHEGEKRPRTEEVLMQLKMALAFQISKDE